MANDKIEITDEMIADAKGCAYHGCTSCKMLPIHSRDAVNCISTLAAALEAERAKGPGVWTDAPEGATAADVYWYGEGIRKRWPAPKTYTRDLPKTSTRLRAESIIGPKGDKLDGDEWERAVAAVERELG